MLFCVDELEIIYSFGHNKYKSEYFVVINVFFVSLWVTTMAGDRLQIQITSQ